MKDRILIICPFHALLKAKTLFLITALNLIKLMLHCPAEGNVIISVVEKGKSICWLQSQTKHRRKEQKALEEINATETSLIIAVIKRDVISLAIKHGCLSEGDMIRCAEARRTEELLHKRLPVVRDPQWRADYVFRSLGSQYSLQPFSSTCLSSQDNDPSLQGLGSNRLQLSIHLTWGWTWKLVPAGGPLSAMSETQDSYCPNWLEV